MPSKMDTELAFVQHALNLRAHRQEVLAANLANADTPNYKARDLEALVDAINATGFGLTFGIHSRIDGTVRRVANRVAAGNVYVNRNIIGAVVGTQPFGGSGLSGTGPKAGGPFYLHRYAHERTVTVNTSAVGGNASLLAME